MCKPPSVNSRVRTFPNIWKFPALKSVNSRVHTSTVCANLQVLTLEFTLSATSGARMSESGDQLLAMIGSSLVGCSTCLQRCQSVHKRALCLFKKTQISRLCAQAHVQQFCSNLHESDVLHKQSCNLVFNYQCMLWTFAMTCVRTDLMPTLWRVVNSVIALFWILGRLLKERNDSEGSPGSRRANHSVPGPRFAHHQRVGECRTAS